MLNCQKAARAFLESNKNWGDFVKIAEATYTVNKYGCLKLPATVMREMGLGPGSHVRVAYLTRDGDKNSFREFFLSPRGIGEANQEDESIAVPEELLRQANISESADIQILCLDGCILIFREDMMSIKELATAADGLRTANEMVSGLPSELNHVKNQLVEFAEGLKERREYEQ